MGAESTNKQPRLMNDENKIKVFLVDDDALFLKTLETEFLNNTDFAIETYATGELCVEHLSHSPDLILLDYHLDGIEKNALNGLETLQAIKTINPKIPVIMLSFEERIGIAIACMQHKAYTYVIKNATSFKRLQKIIVALFNK